jgi:hypothetical protein
LISGVCVATALALFIGDFTHIDLPRVTCPPGSVTCVVAPTP